MSNRTYYAWGDDTKFYLSFQRKRVGGSAAEFDSREALEAEVNRRNARVVWEIDG